MVSIPLATIFISASVLALAASSLIAYLLDNYESTNTSLNNAMGFQYDSLTLTKASVELLRVKDYIGSQLTVAALSAAEVRKFTVTFADDPRIRTVQGAIDVLNSSFYQSVGVRYATDGEIFGASVTFFYPAGSTTPTSVQSFQGYADVLYGGKSQKLYTWTDPTSLLNPAIPIIETPVAGTGDVRVSLDVSRPAYTVDERAFTMPFFNLAANSSFDLLPWQASDGNTWFFIQFTIRRFSLQGVSVLPQSYLSCAAWEQSMNSLLSTVGASYLVYDVNYIPVATSVQAEVQRRTACLKNATNSASCISSPMASHPTPFFRFLYSNFVVPLQNGTLPLVPGFFTDTAHYARLQFNGLPVLVVSLSNTALPPKQSLTSVWIANIAPTATSSSTGDVPVPVLIVFIFLVSLVTTVGVGALVRVTFVRPLDDLIGRMDMVTELETDAIAAAAVDGNMTTSLDDSTTIAAEETTLGNSGIDGHHQLSASSNNLGDRRSRSRDRAVVTFDEVEGVRTAFSKMAASIQWFLLYLPGDVVKDLMAAKRTARSARVMEERELTLIFADIRNFTSATAHLRDQVDTYVELLQMYFEHTSNALTDEGCTIDKYIGDCIMGFWGAPLECVDQAERACTGALRLASVVETIAPRFEVHGWELGVRVGVHSGPAMVGSVGSRRRLNYTALGETVNMASRLEGLCNFTHSTILVSEATAVRARMTVDDGTDDLPFVFRRRGLFVLKGASVPMAVYDLSGLTPAAFDAFQQRVGGGVQSADTSQDKSQTLSVTSVGNPSGQASRSESVHHSEHDGKSSFHDHRSRARSVAGTNQTGNHSRSSQRRARSTLRGLVRHFRVPYDVVTRVDAINHVMVSYDNSQLDDALMQLDNLLRDRDLFASELNRALPESNVLALQLNRVTHDEVVALRDAIAKLLASSAPFDPVTVMTNKS